MTTTVYEQNADAHALRDRVTHAELVLDIAVKDAIDLIRRGRPGYAHFRLARAAERAERVLGPTDWASRSQGEEWVPAPMCPSCIAVQTADYPTPCRSCGGYSRAGGAA